MKAKLTFAALASLLLAACSALSHNETTGDKMNANAATPGEAPSLSNPSTVTPAMNLADLGPAPELTNETWLNTDKPLRLAGLRGKVVLLEMWTFDCINCQHITPFVETWYEKYASQGLVVIGNHFPEFPFESDLENLKQAVQRLSITYPVDQDNNGSTWTAYNNEYWPTLYLIDKRGEIRYIHIGEGNYQATEAAIIALLQEPAIG